MLVKATSSLVGICDLGFEEDKPQIICSQAHTGGKENNEDSEKRSSRNKMKLVPFTCRTKSCQQENIRFCMAIAQFGQLLDAFIPARIAWRE